ncbi:MAG: hypothetical protein CME90_05100 [Hoeflea sp.]|nr:hypothetical protein [Hoeflea sp.]
MKTLRIRCGNTVASNSAGIRVARVKVLAYSISGFLGSVLIGGIMIFIAVGIDAIRVCYFG